MNSFVSTTCFSILRYSNFTQPNKLHTAKQTVRLNLQDNASLWARMQVGEKKMSQEGPHCIVSFLAKIFFLAFIIQPLVSAATGIT